MSLKNAALSALAGLAVTGAAQAAVVEINSNIAVSTTWTADNVYRLKQQIFVLPGATLTIEAGTVVASDPVDLGSLAVSRGAKIFVEGTQEDPVIMTSTADVATWTPDGSHPSGGDPKTGTWREAAREWGNLTIMGSGFISENNIPGNVPTCNANNEAVMEGLIADFPNDPKIRYGGGDDDDCSGAIKYLSLRYGGRVIGVGDELNGLSLGGIGSETEISHLEIMNNVDDGIEIWGGCVNLKYFSIWNIGDDSLDIDQGWRGKAQFGLIVQGWSEDASQGSGVGDNCMELDGAEDSDWQPVTTATIYNMTVIGQPLGGDGGTAWRDNARIQFRNSMWIDLGDQLVRPDLCGDGTNCYGFNGTLDWPSTWTTAYNAVPAHPNDCPPGTYKAQTDGNLIEITDSVFFRNLAPNAYTEATARGVTAAASNNVVEPPALPITTLTRGGPVTRGGLTMLQVIELDPRPVAGGPAATSVSAAPADGFFTPANYRGAFYPAENQLFPGSTVSSTWLCNWTASDAFGFTGAGLRCDWTDLGSALPGTFGCPELTGFGDTLDNNVVQVELSRTPPGALVGLFWGFGPGPANVPFKGGVLKAFGFGPFIFSSDVNGQVIIPFAWPTGIPAGTFEWYWQYAIQDPAAVFNFALSNAVRATN